VTWNALYKLAGLVALVLLLCVVGGMVYTGTYNISAWPQDVRSAVLIIPLTVGGMLLMLMLF
jgi:hypothetical protein